MSEGKATQEHRLLRLNTTLGKDALIPIGFNCTESLSKGFSIVVNVFSEIHHELTASDLVGTNVTIGLVQEDESIRYFNGYVREFVAEGSSRAGQRSTYHMKVVSWLELLLSKRSDCRIFQDMPVKDVIKSVFSAYKELANFKFELTASHPDRRFWVQYNETDLDFFRRICHREGLAFYFSHENGSHCLHIVDEAKSLKALKPKKVKLQAGTASHDHLSKWQSAAKFATGKYERRSYNYMSPSKNQKVIGEATSEVASVPRVMEVESYLFTEGYHDEGEGSTEISKRSTQGVERSKLAVGTGNCRNLSVATHFEVELSTGGEFADKGKSFTFSQVNLIVNDTTGITNCTIEALPKGDLIYPNSVTPTISNLQTAIVTGPKGEEIFTDKYGRIKVQFHWDRLGKFDENTTCWLRVMQNLTGSSFGVHFTPRIGQEVVVAFENGNPDRPFVIGALYHPEQTPPYADFKGTRSGIRSRSTKNGGKDNYNELYFEDRKGNEEVYLQAEKNLKSLIKNDEKRDVNNDQTLSVKNNKVENIGNNEKHSVKNELLIEAGKKITIKVGGSEIELTGSKIVIKSGKVDIDGGKIELN
ncbi:type VI secretion system Vgr family protein [Aurantivibrio infirmus]